MVFNMVRYFGCRKEIEYGGDLRSLNRTRGFFVDHFSIIVCLFYKI